MNGSVVVVGIGTRRRRMHAMTVETRTTRRRSYGQNCNFIYIIRMKDIFTISPYVLGVPAKMLSTPINSMMY